MLRKPIPLQIIIGSLRFIMPSKLETTTQITTSLFFKQFLEERTIANFANQYMPLARYPINQTPTT